MPGAPNLTVSFDCVAGVIFMRTCSEVLGINAQTIVARMQYQQAFRNGTLKNNVAGSVRSYNFVVHPVHPIAV